jgi:2',3'-cyclic-nucleotide 2'-phosphodiesterase (5'-nucleotidase family)
MRRLFAVLFLSLASLGPARAAERVVDVTLLVFSDIYEMDGRDGRGGFARVAGVIGAERARRKNTLVAFAGDTLSPSLLSSLDKGAHIVELLNLARIDAFTPGNHEFDFGEDVFRARMAELKTTRLAANLRDDAGKLVPGFADNAVFEMDGLRIGVFGLTEDESENRSNTGTLRVAPAVATAKRQAEALRAAGADIVVAVSHSEWKDDLRLAKSGLIDVLLSGHDHNLFVAYDGRTAIAETQADGAQVVAVDLAVTLSDGPPRKVSWSPKFRILDTADATPDPVVAARAAEIRARLDKGLDEPIGVTRTELDGRKASVRGKETALGDFIADAMRAETRSDVAILNGGSIRGDAVLPAGATLTRKSVLAALPFANRLVTLELSGADLKAALESAYGALGRDAGRFAQISGARLALRRDAVPGSRLTAIEVAGAPLDEKRLYRVATNDYLASGKDGYEAFLGGRPLVEGDAAPLLSAIVIEAVRKAREIAPAVDGRIAIE